MPDTCMKLQGVEICRLSNRGCESDREMAEGFFFFFRRELSVSC